MYKKSIISALILIEGSNFKKTNVSIVKAFINKPLRIKYKRDTTILTVTIYKDFSTIDIEQDYPLWYDTYLTWISKYRTLLEYIK